MAIRYYIAPLIGAGTQSNPLRPATTAVAVDFDADDGRSDDTVVAGRMLVKMDVTPAQHSQIIAIAGVTYIPLEDVVGNVLSLNDPISALDPAKRAAMRNALEAQHVDTDDLQLTDPIGIIIRRIKLRFKLRNAVLRVLDFTEGLDTTIADIPAARRQNITARLQLFGFDTSVLQVTDTIREALRKLWAQNRNAITTDLG
jgi:hypothetical protein